MCVHMLVMFVCFEFWLHALQFVQRVQEQGFAAFLSPVALSISEQGEFPF